MTALKIIPLGGLGEIGLNSMAIVYGDAMVLIDAGLMFPTAQMPGIDAVVPDFSFVLDNLEKLKAIVLTHGHEDHIGALPWLLRRLDVPIWGSSFTLALVRSRLEELGIRGDLREIGPREPFRISDALTVEPVRVTHSTPDATGLIVKTPEGALVHSGDFKLDPDPILGEPTDLERLAQVGDEGALCLLSDSTNSEVSGTTGSERRVAETFVSLFGGAKGRIIVAVFASNLQRIWHVIHLSHRLGRKVALIGRSMNRNVELAQKLGTFELPEKVLVSIEEAVSLPPNQVTLLVTGAQAESRSALMQLLSSELAGRIGENDCVIVSSRAIPGNERAVSEMISALYARGATVIDGAHSPGVHVSGHAAQDEQKRLIEVVRPKHFVPIHGELKHLHRHAHTASAVGLAQNAIHILTDGDVLTFEGTSAVREMPVGSGRLLIDRFTGQVTSSAVVKERLQLAHTGAVVVAVVLDEIRNTLIAGPKLSGNGLSEHEMKSLPDGEPVVANDVRAYCTTARAFDEQTLREELTRSVRRWFKQISSKRPVVVPVVIKL